MREAPSIDIISALQKEGAQIKAHCPGGMKNAQAMLSNVEFCEDLYETSKDCEALILVTEWDHFKNADLAKVKNLMNSPILIDGRNVFKPEEMKKLGFEYHSVGR